MTGITIVDNASLAEFDANANFDGTRIAGPPTITALQAGTNVGSLQILLYFTISNGDKYIVSHSATPPAWDDAGTSVATEGTKASFQTASGYYVDENWYVYPVDTTTHVVGQPEMVSTNVSNISPYLAITGADNTTTVPYSIQFDAAVTHYVLRSATDPVPAVSDPDVITLSPAAQSDSGNITAPGYGVFDIYAFSFDALGNVSNGDYRQYTVRDTIAPTYSGVTAQAVGATSVKVFMSGLADSGSGIALINLLESLDGVVYNLIQSSGTKQSYTLTGINPGEERWYRWDVYDNQDNLLQTTPTHWTQPDNVPDPFDLGVIFKDAVIGTPRYSDPAVIQGCTDGVSIPASASGTAAALTQWSYNGGAWGALPANLTFVGPTSTLQARCTIASAGTYDLTLDLNGITDNVSFSTDSSNPLNEWDLNPSLDYATDRGLFLWKAADGVWHARMAAGSVLTTYTFNIHSSAGFVPGSIVGESVESPDTLDYTTDPTTISAFFQANTSTFYDGVAFELPATPTTLTITITATNTSDFNVYLGQGKVAHNAASGYTLFGTTTTIVTYSQTSQLATAFGDNVYKVEVKKQGDPDANYVDVKSYKDRWSNVGSNSANQTVTPDYHSLAKWSFEGAITVRVTKTGGNMTNPRILPAGHNIPVTVVSPTVVTFNLNSIGNGLVREDGSDLTCFHLELRYDENVVTYGPGYTAWPSGTTGVAYGEVSNNIAQKIVHPLFIAALPLEVDPIPSSGDANTYYVTTADTSWVTRTGANSYTLNFNGKTQIYFNPGFHAFPLSGGDTWGQIKNIPSNRRVYVPGGAYVQMMILQTTGGFTNLSIDGRGFLTNLDADTYGAAPVNGTLTPKFVDPTPTAFGPHIIEFTTTNFSNCEISGLTFSWPVSANIVCDGPTHVHLCQLFGYEDRSDGITYGQNSIAHDLLLVSHDDLQKFYFAGANIRRIVVFEQGTGAVFKLSWSIGRTVTNCDASDIYVIHSSVIYDSEGNASARANDPNYWAYKATSPQGPNCMGLGNGNSDGIHDGTRIGNVSIDLDFPHRYGHINSATWHSGKWWGSTDPTVVKQIKNCVFYNWIWKKKAFLAFTMVARFGAQFTNNIFENWFVEGVGIQDAFHFPSLRTNSPNSLPQTAISNNSMTLIADSVANGDVCQAPIFQFRGKHTGSSSSTVLNTAWPAWFGTVALPGSNALATWHVTNVTTGATGTVSTNTGSSVTHSALTGGSRNTWQSGDEFLLKAA